MAKQSAGILVYRRTGEQVEVLLVHPGGPFWAKKDMWSIPKGETDDEEDLMITALREFKEEVGFEPPQNTFLDLGTAKQGTKVNYIWAVEGDVDTKQFNCTSTFTIEWPPKSGQQQTFPENDRADWFGLNQAKKKLYKYQTIFIERLAKQLNVSISNNNESEPFKSSTSKQAKLF